ncbi:RNA-guided endonuclease InsQ/TnpB family protein [Ferrovum sp. PN-J185]|uniref:RNA-guided endonuclease InsQ/TnpB family protein n=1 Tax=Ferrovum sp. PN-J185 TaxID=1356306 RepID=UPI0009EE2DF3|nr:RNA-guided endonuclease TnpB family protein [Ferrovum sp. PN-J185]
MILVYRYRVKSLNGLLNKQSRAVNMVWNYCNDIQKQALKWNKRWPTGFDLNKLTTGSSKELGLHAGTINAVCEQYAKSRKQHNRPYLRWRSNKRSLGWVPLKGRDLKREGNAFRFSSNTFRVFNSRAIPEGKIKDGTNFSQDRLGNWYLNIVIDIPETEARPIQSGVGIDLGLKDFATLSTGEKIASERQYRKLESRLGIAQRARKKRTAARIHAKIANRRKDFNHKLSTRIVREFDYIAVGNVNAAGLAKTSMAKSVLDASWSFFRNTLAYKAVRHGAWFEEVNERFTTQVCSCCGSVSQSSPKGRADLGMRSWTCLDCGVEHDRDVNAALNILYKSGFGSGHRTPAEGISAL